MTAGTAERSGSPFRAPSAWIPIALAGAATALLAGYLLTGPHEPHMVLENGVARPDESGTARLWQLLMLLQVPSALFIAAWWLPRDPKRTLAMLALQGAAFLAAAAPVILLEM